MAALQVSKVSSPLAHVAKELAIDPRVGATAKAQFTSFFNLNTPVKGDTPNRIPAVGLGVYRANGSDCYDAVKAALAAGYRHIDTAAVYQNEADVGRALRESGVPREEVWVTTKLFNNDQGYESALHAAENSLKKLGLDYVDLYILHWPVPGKRLHSWRALEKLLADGKVKNIGVSNFMIRHLEELLKVCKIKPAINQIELHPYCTREDVQAYCKEHGIVLEAYSPLTKGLKLKEPVLVAIAKEYGVTTAQLLLRWALQRGAVILPKSVNADRIKQNADVFGFHISDKHMSELNALNANLATGWDPRDAE